MALVMSMGAAALAEETTTTTGNTITVSGAKTGETYNIYKLLDLSVNDADPPHSLPIYH